MCHPSTKIPETTLSLQNKDAYCILDPGKTKVSCNRDKDFQAHFIMAASNDECHWGSNEFTKTQVHGVPSSKCVYYAPWTEAAILSAKNCIGLAQFSDNKVLECHQAAGGSVHAIMEFDPLRYEISVNNALDALSFQTAQSLACSYCNFAFNPDAPLSKLILVGPKEENSSLCHLLLTSDCVEERITAQFLRNSWFSVLNKDNAGNRGNLFEAFVCQNFSHVPANHVIFQESRPTHPGWGSLKKLPNCQ